MRPDDLCTTPAEHAALAALRERAGSGSPMERHCHRQFLICERLAGERAYDREVVLVACWLHDAGLWTASKDPYVTEGARLVQQVVAPFGWPQERLQLCMDAAEQHHAPRSVERLGPEVELLRRSDLVDVSRGLVNFGIERAWLRELFRQIPRTGIWRHMLGPATVQELRHRPRSLVGVFLAPRRTTV
ncbi:hypothetical protein [Paraconexibacter sp.]|uniref:hypothetical protein n=1 Tax=Paraconexibacter sp. TaxID=2949640 RepID=UPI003567E6BE